MSAASALSASREASPLPEDASEVGWQSSYCTASNRRRPRRTRTGLDVGGSSSQWSRGTPSAAGAPTMGAEFNRRASSSALRLEPSLMKINVRK